jgi:hypothetical protein
MPRKAIPGLVPRTFRVPEAEYNMILSFFQNSPTGMTGTDAIRKMISVLGRHCYALQNAGKQASFEHIAEIESVMLGTLAPTATPTEAPNDDDD